MGENSRYINYTIGDRHTFAEPNFPKKRVNAYKFMMAILAGFYLEEYSEGVAKCEITLPFSRCARWLGYNLNENNWDRIAEEINTNLTDVMSISATLRTHRGVECVSFIQDISLVGDDITINLNADFAEFLYRTSLIHFDGGCNERIEE